MRDIKFTYSRTNAGRKHYLNEKDVGVLLSRLPEELWERLREVHFNDQAFGRRCPGYATAGHREISICALPSSVSLSSFATRSGIRPFGAVRGRQWSTIAVRRFLLYDVFLHELGHLQIVEPSTRRVRRRFAGEKKVQEFANNWRRQLWSSWFDHSDPVHNRATHEELEQLN